MNSRRETGGASAGKRLLTISGTLGKVFGGGLNVNYIGGIGMDQKILDDALKLVENDIHAAGWDKPSRVYSINVINGEPVFVLQAITGEHPVTVLPTLPVMKVSEGVAIVNEAWTYPDSLLDSMKDNEHAKVMMDALWRTMPPSKHPNRVEMRTAMAVMRDGTVSFVSRRRGKDPEAHEGGRYDGRVVEAMRDAMGVQHQSEDW